MSTIKTTANHAEVHAFLTNKLSLPVTHLTPIHGGEIAIAYEVQTKTTDLIFRLGPSINNFLKDKLAHERFNSSSIPIPRVIETGKYNQNLVFALSEKADGLRIDKLSREDLKSLVPSIIKSLIAIHAAPIPSINSFGYWTAEQSPVAASWADFLVSDTANYIPNGATRVAAIEIKDWHARFNELSSKVPNVCHLVHGDFSFDNSFAKGTRISGVIDWAESIYGDPLYDLTWLTFWYADKTYLKEYLATPEGLEIGGKATVDRMQCYTLRIGLRALFHFQKSAQPKAYEWTVNRMKEEFLVDRL